MADALCGPSNPLQNLQKHAQVDRTLQQDRLVGNRQSPAQGFRTADPRAGSLDAEFHAFETSVPNPFQFQQPELFHPQQHIPSVPGGWASDFQRLSISQSPIPAQQFRAEAPLIKSTSLGGWQNEFIRQRSGAGTPISKGKQAVRDVDPQLNQYQGSAMMSYPQPMTYQPFTGTYLYQPQQQQPVTQMDIDQQQRQDQISIEAFEAAFTDALAHAQEMDQDRAQPPIPFAQVDLPQQDQNIKIGSDALPYVEKQDRTKELNTRDADELARTAGEVVDSLSHDTSEKFQNSQFLHLMRRIRDREVKVQDNELQDTMTGNPASSSQITSPQNQMTEQPQIPDQVVLDSHFDFPDMDAVYAETNSDAAWNDDVQDPAFFHSGTPMQAPQPFPSYFPTSYDNPIPPATQIQALHPGGKLYPDQSPLLRQAELTGETEVKMSGAVPPTTDGGSTVEDGARLEKKISASDFEYVDESAGLARRFVRAPRADAVMGF